MKWLTKQEVEKLKKIWATASKKEIMEVFPERRYASLAARARKLGLKSNRRKNSIGDLSPLLNETKKAYYWLGFIIADGYLSKQNALSVTISIKDKKHLKQLAELLKTHVKSVKTNKMYSLKTEAIRISVGDSVRVPQIRKKFGMTSTNKTYNPPTLPKMDRGQFISFLAGYFDGDGCIAKQGNYGKYKREDVVIQVKCHKSWFEILCEMEKRLYKELKFTLKRNHVSINKQGYAFWKISNNKIIKKLKSELICFDLPLMERKWKKILL